MYILHLYFKYLIDKHCIYVDFLELMDKKMVTLPGMVTIFSSQYKIIV